MGMEVAGSEIVHGNGEVRVGSFSNPHEKENRKLHHLGEGVTEPVKFGSHGADETAKENGDIVLNANFPKDAADEWPPEQKMHSFYIVRYRFYDKPNLKAKIDQADKEIWKRNHQRVLILDRIKAKRLDRALIIEQLRSLGQEHRQYRTVVYEKLNEMKPLKDALGSLRDSNNAGSDKIQRLNYRMQHEVISLSEEKQLIREIKQLEGTRDKVIANAAMRAKFEESMGQKEVVQNQVTLIGTDLDGVRKEREVVKSRIKQLEDELKLIDGDIGTLQLELTSILEKRDKAVETIYELRRQRDGKNACFFQNRTLLNNAKDLAAEKNIEALKELSCEEVEKFMASWNSSKSFRDDYEKGISASLDIRQLSRDGCMRNPHEKPLFLVQQTNMPTEAQTLAKASPKPAKQDPEPVKEQEHTAAEKESKRKQEEPKTVVKLNNEEDDEEYYIVEMPKKENEIDEATLKEIKKQEEMEKQKQAMERKKKLAEKAAAKAALRAQKEAEKKQKEREKKMKKKESFSAAEAERFEKVEENVKIPVTGKTKESKDVSTTVSVRYRGRTKCCDSIPKAILKRKRSNKYLLWVAAAAVVVGVILALMFN